MKNNMIDFIFEKPINVFLDNLLDYNYWNDNYWNASACGQTNIIENDNEYIIKVSASGFSKEDLDVKLENKYLIVTGKHEEKNEKYTLKEYNKKSFKRSFKIPNNIEDEFSAKFENGILSITINKPKESPKIDSKRITIE